MVFQERTYSVLIVSATDSFTNSVMPLLPVTDYWPVSTVRSVGEARRKLTDTEFDIVLINTPLPDDFGMGLAIRETLPRRGVAALSGKNASTPPIPIYSPVEEHFSYTEPEHPTPCQQALSRLRFLPGLVLHRPEEWGMPENAAASAVDVSSPDRLGKAEALYNAADRRWVIDHHGTNPHFGQINWVEGDVPATGILVNRLYRALGVPLVIARRSSKVYEGSAVNINYVSGSDHHIETMSLSRRAVNEGQRALIVDDFLKGGGTAKGMIDLMAEFDVEVVGTAFVMSTENPNQRCIRNEKALMTMNVTNDPASLTVRPAPWLRELAGEGAVCAEQEGTN